MSWPSQTLCTLLVWGLRTELPVICPLFHAVSSDGMSTRQWNTLWVTRVFLMVAVVLGLAAMSLTSKVILDTASRMHVIIARWLYFSTGMQRGTSRDALLRACISLRCVLTRSTLLHAALSPQLLWNCWSCACTWIN